MAISRIIKKAQAGELIRRLGPGIITAALIFGPGSLTINTKLGASYGYSLLWVLIIAMILMTAFTTMSARIGLGGNGSLIEKIKKEFGKSLTMIVGGGVFLTTASFQAGNTIGASIAFSELFSTPLSWWVAIFTSATIFLLFFKSFYKILEKLMIVLVLVMLASFLLTIVMSKPSLTAILKGMIPSIPSGAEYLMITLTASSFSIVGAFYQSYLVQEKGWRVEEKKRCLQDSKIGVIILGLLSATVMISASSVLHRNNIEVSSASDLGMALEPLFGSITSKVFMIGFFSASFSSMLGNATVGGVILSDTLFSESKLSSMKVRAMIILIILVGALVALVFGALPIQLIIFAQSITVMLVPIAAVVMMIMANVKKQPSELKNNRLSNTLGALGILVLLIMSVYSINYIFF